jgi:DNA-binding NarL/FixJ family response regulator
MGLRCLLLTRDAAVLEIVRTSFNAAHVDLEMRSDAATAIEFSASRHVDGFVIDCDDVSGGRDVILHIRNSRSNRLSVTFAVVNGTTTVSTAIEAGANFVLGKPVEYEALRHFLSIALPRMEREHRRYFRYKVDLSVEVISQTGDTFTGKLTNVSEGGLAMTCFGPALSAEVPKVRFTMPGVHSHPFQAKAEVVWESAFAAGLRFLHIELGSRAHFKAWLDSLAAQAQFRESA